MSTRKYLDYEGVKYLWSKMNGKVEDVTKYETINITLTTDTGVGVSTTVTVTVDGKSTNYSYNNSPITIEIEGGKSCSITFGSYTGFKKPSPITFTSIKNFSRNISLVYKTTVIGVFIEDHTGKLHKPSEWTDTTPSSIVISNGDCAIGLALHYIINNRNDGSGNSSKPRRFSSNDNSDLEAALITAINNGQVDSPKYSEATSGLYNGKTSSENIKIIAAGYSHTTDGFSGEPYIEECLNYIFPDGSKGHCPNTTELKMYVDNWAEVNNALSICGGDVMYPGDTGNMNILSSTLDSDGSILVLTIMSSSGFYMTPFGRGSAGEIRPVKYIDL